MRTVDACRTCLRRSWLLARLGGHLDTARADIEPLLGLTDRDLVAAVGGRHRSELEAELEDFRPQAALDRVQSAGLRAVCRCRRAYPHRLRALESPPAVLHVAGSWDLVAGEMTPAVAVVGSRRASAYGTEVGAWMGRCLASAGIPVLSGLALGIDSAAHQGALAAGGPSIAVLPGGAERPYPSSRRALYRRLLAGGAVVSELPPGTAARRWMFPARNRIIAALSAMTVVVEAATGSGALLTASWARALGRLVGAVPGRITSPAAEGCHQLLVDGARLIRGPEDVLDALFADGPRPVVPDGRPDLDSAGRAVLSAIAEGSETVEMLGRTGGRSDQLLATLGWLELAGYVRRGAGGRYSVVP